MAEATLNFDESTLDHSSDLYHLYDRLYQGMVKANAVDAPDFPSPEDLLVLDENGNATFDTDGNPVIDAGKKQHADEMAAEYSDILMKNSAYLFANAIMSVMAGGGSGAGGTSTGFVSRAGDSMKGALRALYGLEAGCDGHKILDLTINAANEKWAVVSDYLRVIKDVTVDGVLNVGDGISFDCNKVIFYDKGELRLDNSSIGIKGDVAVDGTFTLGSVLINKSGLFWGGKEFYHAGNSNKADIDWTMRHAHVNGDLNIAGKIAVGGSLEALSGFALGDLGSKMLYSATESHIGEDGKAHNSAWVVLESDLHIVSGHGVKFGNDYILNVRNNNVVSLSAPGKTLNLGDSDNGVGTQKISLQSDIYDYTNSFQLISKEGHAHFPNGLTVDVAVNGSEVLSTYRNDADNVGVLFEHQIRFGSTDGPVIYQDPNSRGLNIQVPYTHVVNNINTTEQLQFNTYFDATTSPFRNRDLPWSATLHFDTDGEFFAFDKPVEANYFAIKSEGCHTRLTKGALFFDDGKFIEEATDGLRYAGNGYFDANISSPSFASGFAGYGWAVKDEVTNGGFHATFDSITIRKKMRVYELEVQKLSVTNGSLWVSDSCSGDEVIKL